MMLLVIHMHDVEWTGDKLHVHVATSSQLLYHVSPHLILCGAARDFQADGFIVHGHFDVVWFVSAFD